MEQVAVVGWAQTRHARAMELRTDRDMIHEVVSGALRSCSMTIRDIDVVVDAGSDLLDGRSTSNCISIDAMGAHFKEEARVAGDGLLAALYAYMRIASGLFGSALVVAGGKGSMSSARELSRAMGDPFHVRPLGLDALSAGALQARSYMQRYSVCLEDVAGVASRNRAEGERNPYAQLRSAVSVAEVLSSPEISPPIRELEACPVTDGACAVVLVDWASARNLGVRPAWITGAGQAQEPYSLGARDLFRASSSAEAARRAYAIAGVRDPLSEFDVVELSGCYAHQELMLYEALGLCGEGEAQALAASGGTGPGGRCRVNPSGGALCANPVTATGLVRLAEAAAQVSNRAGELQVDGAEKALAHVSEGFAMQSAACVVVER